MEYKKFIGKKVVLTLKDGTMLIGILENLLGHFKGRRKHKFIFESLAFNDGSFLYGVFQKKT